MIMIKAFALIPRKEGVSVERFHAHWRDVHAPLARRIKTIRRYSQSHAIRQAVDGLPGSIYEGVAEVWFDDLDTALGMGADPDYVDGAGADEPNFIDQSRLTFLFCTDPLPDKAGGLTPSDHEVKSLLLLRNASNGNWLDDQLIPCALKLPDVQRVGLARAIPGATEERQLFDAVLELSWPNLASHDRAWADPAAEELCELVISSVAREASASLVAEVYQVIWP